MLLVVKTFALIFSLFFFAAASARDVRILVLNEVSSSKCDAKDVANVQGLYQIGLNGSELPFHAPFAWDECTDGTLLTSLGQDILRSGMADRVIFMPVGVEGSHIEDWFAGGRAQEKLKLALHEAASNNVRFEYVLWNGALVDGPISASHYQINVQKILKVVKMSTAADKFIISKSISVGKEKFPRSVMHPWDPLVGRFAGPDLRVLGDAYRSDDGNFNLLGKRKLAELWLRSMQDADAESQRYQKESLLYYFKL